MVDDLAMKGKRFLHLAPERCFEAKLRSMMGENYVTADYLEPCVDLKLDICRMDLPDACFDAAYCAHVLEHVDDDRAAMREFLRILKPGGWVIFTIPITADRTFEDPSIKDPKKRLELFGQVDHVRRYGMDVISRFTDAGFDLTVVKPEEVFSPEELKAYAMAAGGELFICEKPLAHG
ncbi:hypothetical protein Hsar01_02876 [Haloferula sargassicola]|uniref:Methyltransferase type 11 domain-containing protein n=2 Tax=Haloferula sargassicola TaxID=490096 RepID=A0ABP9UQD1_9BACT